MRSRLILAFALTILVALISSIFFLRQSARESVDEFYQRGGFIGAYPLITQLEAHYRAKHSWAGAEEILSGRMPHGMMTGNGPGSSGPPGTGAGGPRNEDTFLLADQNGVLQFTETPVTFSAAELESTLQIAVDGDIVGYLIPPEGVSLPGFDYRSTLESALNSSIRNAALVAGGFAIILAFGLAYAIQRPVQQLTNAAGELAQGNLSQRVVVKGGGELETLGLVFNDMAASLEKAEQTRRALTADIAHELRTPLAVQRANLEAIQDGLYPLDQESIIRVLEQNLLLTHLVEDLRTLALSDAGGLQLEKTETDINELVSGIVARFQPEAGKKQIDLVFEPADGIPRIALDARRIEQIMYNLLGNALRHSRDLGQIMIQTEVENGILLISVRDNGPGIAPEDLEKLFTRFYRADSSRNRESGGSGLGLTIAQRLAQAHGGELTAANHPEGGALFTISLPVGRKSG